MHFEIVLRQSPGTPTTSNATADDRHLSSAGFAGDHLVCFLVSRWWRWAKRRPLARGKTGAATREQGFVDDAEEKGQDGAQNEHGGEETLYDTRFAATRHHTVEYDVGDNET